MGARRETKMESHAPSITSIARTPTGLIVTGFDDDSNPRSLCRGHSNELADAFVSESPQKRKRKASTTPRSKRRRPLHVVIPAEWMPSESDAPAMVTDELCLSEELEVGRQWVHGLAEHTKLLALDFDLTCVAVDTRGHWQGSAEDLASCMRPVMRELIVAACTLGMRVAVVSFSPQHQLIKEVLRLCIPEHAEEIMIRAGQPKSIPVCKAYSYSTAALQRTDCQLQVAKNKQRHIASVLEELENEQARFSMSQVMLVDDNFRNVEDARIGGCQAVWFNPEESLSFACDLCQCIGTTSASLCCKSCSASIASSPQAQVFAPQLIMV